VSDSDSDLQLAASMAKAADAGELYAASVSRSGGTVLALSRKDDEKLLLVGCPADTYPGAARRFTGDELATDGDVPVLFKLCRPSPVNAEALRALLHWTAPRLGGTEPAAGLGDRLGLATPGHVRAVSGSGVLPFLAQQSIREMERTGRDPQKVMDSASWGVFEAGWRGGFGSDADHLKRTEDIDWCLEAGFTMFTIDPGDHVADEADSEDAAKLAERLPALPWDGLEATEADLRLRYVGREFVLPGPGGDVAVSFDEETFLRAAVKYGRAVAHVVQLARHLESKAPQRTTELEMSVDETASPTSTAEHYFVAAELCRLGVTPVSLAPRFVGEFEKGIDYKGDLDLFRARFAEHVAVARRFGPYKISLHSGSDKFSVYPICAELAAGMVHLKTAGTSYLEALRVICEIERDLFCEILEFAHERYDEDKRTYHVSADPAVVPHADGASDDELRSTLDTDDGRQLLHVTYGSVLTADGGERFRPRIISALKANEERHYEALASHIGRHVSPFVRPE